MVGTSAPTLAAGAAAPVWEKAKLMVARWYSGRRSRSVCLRKSLGEGSCELARASTGDERADSERAGECRGGLGRKRSRLFFSDVGVAVGESADSEVRSRREGVRRDGVGEGEAAAGDGARASLSTTSRALFSRSIWATVAGPGTTKRGGGARAEA